MSLNSYLKIIRISNGLMAAIAVLIGFIIAISGYNISSVELLYGILSVFFLTSAGIVINDYYDKDIDKINASHRPIPSGKMSEKHGLFYSMVLFFIGLCLAYNINYYCLELALVNVFLEFLYAKSLKKMFLIGNIVDSWFVASSFLFGYLIVTVEFSFLLLFLALLAFLSNMGREIFGDIEDVIGDQTLGAETIPIKLGKKKAKLMGSLFILSAVAISIVPFAMNLVGMYYIYLVLLADIIFIISLTKNPRKNQQLTRLAMSIALLGFLAGFL